MTNTAQQAGRAESDWIFGYVGTFAVFIIIALGSLSIDLTIPTVPSMARSYNTDIETVQLIITAYMAGNVVGQVFWGVLSDVFGRRPAMIAALSGFSLSCLAIIIAPTIEVVLILRVIQGFCGSAGPSMGRTIIRDVASGERGARIMSTAIMLTGLSPAIGPMLGSSLLFVMDWRGIYIGTALFGLALILAFVFRVPETRPASVKEGRPLAAIARNVPILMRDGSFLSGTAITACVFGCFFAFISASPTVFVDVFGISDKIFGFFVGAMILARIGGSYLSRRFVMTRGIPALTIAGLAVMGAGCLVMVPYFFTVAPGLIPVLVALFLVAMGSGMVQPNVTMIALKNTGMATGIAAAISGTFHTLGGTISSFLVAATYQGAVAHLAAIAIGFWVLACLVMTLYMKSPANR